MNEVFSSSSSSLFSPEGGKWQEGIEDLKRDKEIQGCVASVPDLAPGNRTEAKAFTLKTAEPGLWVRPAWPFLPLCIHLSATVHKWEGFRLTGLRKAPERDSGGPEEWQGTLISGLTGNIEGHSDSPCIWGCLGMSQGGLKLGWENMSQISSLGLSVTRVYVLIWPHPEANEPNTTSHVCY